MGIFSRLRPSFLTVNTMVAVLIGVAAYSGFFKSFSDVGGKELTMLGALVAYSLIGFGAALLGKWRYASHIAHGLPMWALGFTGMGMLLAVSNVGVLSADTVAIVFRDLVMAIAPNILGIVLMSWLREVVWWTGEEEI